VYLNAIVAVCNQPSKPSSAPNQQGSQCVAFMYRTNNNEGHQLQTVNKLEFRGRAADAKGKVQVGNMDGHGGHGIIWEDRRTGQKQNIPPQTRQTSSKPQPKGLTSYKQTTNK